MRVQVSTKRQTFCFLTDAIQQLDEMGLTGLLAARGSGLRCATFTPARAADLEQADVLVLTAAEGEVPLVDALMRLRRVGL
jgi:hypothetical protein